MESLLAGFFHRPSAKISSPVSAKLCSSNFVGSHVAAAQVLRCKSLGNASKISGMPLRLRTSQRNVFLRDSVQRIVNSFDSSNTRRSSKHTIRTSSQSLESEPYKSRWESLQQAFYAFYMFSRPHTVIGTALSIVSVSLLAVQNFADLSPLFVRGVLEAIVAALFMNVYIVGLNQVSDIEIDKVNKPYLPLASGEYSVKTGVLIIASFATLSLWLGYVVGSQPLLWALVVSFILGTAYSINIPFFRWKRFAFAAAMCILAVRAVIVQIAFYLHIQTFVYQRPAVFTKPVIFATAFMSFFSVVIALFKDIPDIVGDKIYGIQSFSVKLGQEKVFWICIYLLEIAYAVAIAVGAASACSWSKWTTVIGHTVLGWLLWSRAKTMDFKNKAAITSFYMFIWKLFYAEYLLIPLVR